VPCSGGEEYSTTCSLLLVAQTPKNLCQILTKRMNWGSSDIRSKRRFHFFFPLTIIEKETAASDLRYWSNAEEELPERGKEGKKERKEQLEFVRNSKNPTGLPAQISQEKVPRK